MKPTCKALGVSHSNVLRRLHRPPDWVDGRLSKSDVARCSQDAKLAGELG